ncbi:MAG: T9SS type A sorting domain-containing protein [Flavobacteriales bacterium]|nr:T9SS type A sorting domain-containing protein [Flavobacteriales bacterium]
MDYGFGPVTPDPSMLCTVLNSTCPFVNPMANGAVYWDANSNGVRDIGETGYPFATVNVQPGNYTYGVAADGSFGLPLPVDTYTLSATGTSPYVQSIMPATYTAVLDSATSMSNGNDFGVVLQPGIQDLRIDAYFQPARPGFDDVATITYRNVGTTVMTGSVTLTFDADQTWESADVVPDALNGNVAAWNFSNLAVGETRVIQVTLHTDVSVTIGTPLTHVLVVDPAATDETPADNTLVVDGEVVGSFDPNDKAVSPSAATPAEVAMGAELTYTVRFQNTGTYLAERVIITDTLSADLQWNTLRVISSSHTCSWVLLNNGVLRFTFEQIMLPDSGANEPGSHGFVKFAMKPVTTLVNGAQVGNIANIYFDFNEPVITNEAVFTVDIASGMADAVRNNDLRLWPSPASDVLFVAHRTERVLSMELLDLRGRPLLVAGAVDHLDVSQLAAGMYVVRVNTPAASYVRSVVKR